MRKKSTHKDLVNAKKSKANEWCNQFNKTAKYLKKTFGGYQYLCVEE
tara:strand:- start:318 stop:458 length:141 start_codon:yes stop_codon:yes gene_type:complete